MNEFRVWDNRNNKYIKHNDDSMFMFDTYGNLVKFERDKCTVHINTESPKTLKICPSCAYIPEFFSGMLDKNKRKIYEGDVIKFLNYEWEVKYDKSRYAFIIVDDKGVKLFMHDLKYLDGFKNLEIVGNIHNTTDKNINCVLDLTEDMVVKELLK